MESQSTVKQLVGWLVGKTSGEIHGIVKNEYIVEKIIKTQRTPSGFIVYTEENIYDVDWLDLDVLFICARQRIQDFLESKLTL